MKPRLARPLLAAIVGAALVAGGAVSASPASGAPLTAAPIVAAEPPPEEEPSTPAEEPSTPTAEPSTPTAEPSTPTAEPSTPTAEPSTPTAEPSTPTPEPSTPADPADTEAPKGTFKLSRTSIWVGQKITFTQGFADFSDNITPDNQIVRKISWGDGSVTTLSPNATSYVKTYTRAGKFTVTETLTDAAGQVGTSTSKFTVTVVVPGKFSLSRSTAYQGQRFNVNISKPSGVTRLEINWGDGTYSYSPAHHSLSAKSVTGYILYREGNPALGKLTGKHTVTVTLFNKYGATSPIKAGTINILKDSWKPVLKITKPKSPSRVSSWKTVRGTVTDKGAGVRNVYVGATRLTKSGKIYCTSPISKNSSKMKWKRIKTDSQAMKYCYIFKVKVTKGKWSLKLPKGLTTGTLWVDAQASDWSDRVTNKSRATRLTRS